MDDGPCVSNRFSASQKQRVLYLLDFLFPTFSRESACSVDILYVTVVVYI